MQIPVSEKIKAIKWLSPEIQDKAIGNLNC